MARPAVEGEGGSAGRSMGEAIDEAVDGGTLQSGGGYRS